MRGLFLLYVFIMIYMKGYAQESFPFLTDYPSLTGSTAITASYLFSVPSDNKLKKEVLSFNNKYSTRLLYLNSPLSLKLQEEIEIEIYNINDRLNIIKSKNEELNFYNYRIKKQNKKLLRIVQQMIVNLKIASNSQTTSNILLGEKMNLYQNVMISVNKIDRQLDVIEDAINKSLIVNRILGRY